MVYVLATDPNYIITNGKGTSGVASPEGGNSVTRMQTSYLPCPEALYDPLGPVYLCNFKHPDELITEPVCSFTMHPFGFRGH